MLNCFGRPADVYSRMSVLSVARSCRVSPSLAPPKKRAGGDVASCSSAPKFRQDVADGRFPGSGVSD